MTLPAVFRTYATDFDDDPTAVLDFVQRHLSPTRRKLLAFMRAQQCRVSLREPSLTTRRPAVRGIVCNACAVY